MVKTVENSREQLKIFGGWVVNHFQKDWLTEKRPLKKIASDGANRQTDRQSNSKIESAQCAVKIFNNIPYN